MVHLFGRARADPPLQLPRLDGSSWPDQVAFGRASFDSSTLYELGYRKAFEPQAHELADLLVAAVLARVGTGASVEDEPYLRRVLTTAAQVGAGLGAVEAPVAGSHEATTDRRMCAALWQARRGLPSMAQNWERLAAYLLQCGYYLARTSPGNLPSLLEALEGDQHRR